MSDLKKVETHFAFGENWADYAKNIDAIKIEEAEKGLLQLVTKEELVGKTFLDIGCGSGLHALAALRLGAARVVATDIDSNSVATTKEVLKNHAPQGANYEVWEISVFDLNHVLKQQFDIVYSWGVLHHTGDMYSAIAKASELVKPEGLLVLALYRKTTLCGVWKYIKRWYAQASEISQKRAQKFYISLYKLRCCFTGKNFKTMRNNYHTSRGMSFEHDVHDWLGGYPYESISTTELQTEMTSHNFTDVRSVVHGKSFGLFGSGCDEYVFKKNSIFKRT